MLKKILITPYFGDFPGWMDKFRPPIGYEWLLDTDIEKFKQRVRDKLGIEYPGAVGSGKVWDYRCALGLLYEEEIKGYDFWGTMDFDVVWGDVNKFIPDETLSELDLFSSHDTYVCGFFNLYRNSKEMNELFKGYPDWKEKMIHPEPNGWVEMEYSKTLESSGLKYKYSYYQGYPYTKNPILKTEGDSLFQNINGTWTEIAYFHFRHAKKWPLPEVEADKKYPIEHNPYAIVIQLEERIAEYCGSKYAVAVESCTSAIFLSLMYNKMYGDWSDEIELPCHTYPGVACSVLHSGAKIKFINKKWNGEYKLSPLNIWDAALRFRRGMYHGGFQCLSFHIKKLLAVGRGGIILTDDWNAYEWFKKARFDGRSPVPLREDNFTMLGWNCYMTPSDAARAVQLFEVIKNTELPDLNVESQGYPDLSKFPIYTT